MPKVDMSDRAVTIRLKRVSQLRRLALSLANATIKDGSVKKYPTAMTSEPDKHSGK